MEKRTNIDFSKHELITKNDSLCKIHWLKIPNTTDNNVKFIHVENILLVVGDFGRWTFCSDFNPEKFSKSGVFYDYWCEKIEMGSEQQTQVFDSEIAEKLINEKIEELKENSETDEFDEICFEDDDKKEEYEFWNDLLNYCNDDFEFTTYFRDNKPTSLDYDDMPFCKKQHHFLDAIFDAFEEIINRFSNSNQNNQ